MIKCEKELQSPCAVQTAVKWSQSCLMHFTLARFYVRSKGKCSWCKGLAV